MIAQCHNYLELVLHLGMVQSYVWEHITQLVTSLICEESAWPQEEFTGPRVTLRMCFYGALF